MPKGGRKVFLCTACGWESPQWFGFCRSCGSQTPLVEAPVPTSTPTPRQGWVSGGPAPVELAQVQGDASPRLPLPFPEVNRVLGGGLVLGSILLVAGEPGMGKSTLLLQVAHAMAGQGKVAYLSGEESPEQVLLRARRLGIRGEGIFLLTDPCIDSLWQHLDALTPSLLIVDSIQTVYTEGVEGTPGSILQVRECARLLLQWGKAHRTPVVLVGHVTKEGEVAGPQVLQHMVDAVLLLEGERNTPLRILRAVKNRFGPTDEVAVLEMGPQGLREVPDPSRYLLSGRAPAPGSVVAPLLVGDRPLLVEVQALTGPAGNFAPRRDAVGYDERRLRSVAAALAQRARFPVGDKDIAVKVVGGIRADDPAADLAVALAIASSVRDVPLEPGAVAFGEVGLTGELRPVPHTRRRLQETARLGFTAVILPLREEEPIPPGLTVYPVGTLRQALEKALPQRG